MLLVVVEVFFFCVNDFLRRSYLTILPFLMQCCLTAIGRGCHSCPWAWQISLIAHLWDIYSTYNLSNNVSHIDLVVCFVLPGCFSRTSPLNLRQELAQMEETPDQNQHSHLAIRCTTLKIRFPTLCHKGSQPFHDSSI